MVLSCMNNIQVLGRTERYGWESYFCCEEATRFSCFGGQISVGKDDKKELVIVSKFPSAKTTKLW